jgi:hypothetical protein
VAAHREGCLERFEDAARHLAGVLRTSHPGEEHRELVSTESRDGPPPAYGGGAHHVRGPDLALEKTGDLLQKRISHRVPERVVHSLEPVQVDVEECGCVAAPSCAIEGLVHAPRERVPAGQPGESIAVGAAAGAFGLLAQLQAFPGGADHRLDPKGKQRPGDRGLLEVRDPELDRPLHGGEIGGRGNQKDRGPGFHPLVALDRGTDLERLPRRDRRVDDHRARTHLVEGFGDRGAGPEDAEAALAKRALEHLHELGARAPQQHPGRRIALEIGGHLHFSIGWVGASQQRKREDPPGDSRAPAAGRFRGGPSVADLRRGGCPSKELRRRGVGLAGFHQLVSGCEPRSVRRAWNRRSIRRFAAPAHP